MQRLVPVALVLQMQLLHAAANADDVSAAVPAKCTEPGGPNATGTARNDPVNLAARPLWDELMRQQDLVEGWPPQPFALNWGLGRDIHDAGGMPHYMKDGHGCLIDDEFMILAGGFQCPDEHVATSPCSK
jgi:hypothetical protein